jgi:hypothetical protein
MSILTPRKPDKGPKDQGPANKGLLNKEHSKLKRIVIICSCIALGVAALGLVSGLALSNGIGVQDGNPLGNLIKGKKALHKHHGGAHKHHRGHKGKGGGSKNAVPTIDSVTNNGPINEGSAATITVTATDPEGTTLTL